MSPQLHALVLASASAGFLCALTWQFMMLPRLDGLVSGRLSRPSAIEFVLLVGSLLGHGASIGVSASIVGKRLLASKSALGASLVATTIPLLAVPLFHLWLTAMVAVIHSFDGGIYLVVWYFVPLLPMFVIAPILGSIIWRRAA